MTNFEAVNSTVETTEATIVNELNHFKVLSSVNVVGKTEQKNGLTYLPWSEAWGEVKKRYPDASYRVIMHDGLPYLCDPNTGYMVFTEVTIEGITHMMWLPVMDSTNSAMKPAPYEVTTRYGKKFTVQAASMTDINKTLMRCLCKNIAMFGLGLFGIYADEDKWYEEQDGDLPGKVKQQAQAANKTGKANAASAKVKSATSAQAVQMPTPAPVSQAQTPVQVQNATPTTPAAPAIPTPAPVLKVVYESAGDGKTLKVSNLENPLVFNGMPTAAPTDELYIAAGKQVFTLTNDVFVKAGICNTDCRSALNKIISTHNTEALSELNNLLANASSLNEEGKKTLAAVSTMLSRFLFSDLTA